MAVILSWLQCVNYEIVSNLSCILQYATSMIKSCPTCIDHGPLTRYVKLQVAHAPGMPGTYIPPPPISKETAS